MSASYQSLNTHSFSFVLSSRNSDLWRLSLVQIATQQLCRCLFFETTMVLGHASWILPVSSCRILKRCLHAQGLKFNKIKNDSASSKTCLYEWPHFSTASGRHWRIQWLLVQFGALPWFVLRCWQLSHQQCKCKYNGKGEHCFIVSMNIVLTL